MPKNEENLLYCGRNIYLDLDTGSEYSKTADEQFEEVIDKRTDFIKNFINKNKKED